MRGISALLNLILNLYNLWHQVCLVPPTPSADISKGASWSAPSLSGQSCLLLLYKFSWWFIHTDCLFGKSRLPNEEPPASMFGIKQTLSSTSIQARSGRNVDI